jgi:hypothetical protein
MFKTSNNDDKNLYQKADEKIMVGVNRVVRAWNWTTGRTKADLANTMVVTSTIVDITSSFVDGRGNYMAGGLCMVVMAPYIIRRNKEFEKKEKKAFEKNALDSSIESAKDYCKIYGPVVEVASAMFFLPPSYPAAHMWGVGNSIWGSQLYILRADYLPPRKNALARGWERTKALLRNPIPQLAYTASVLRNW